MSSMFHLTEKSEADLAFMRLIGFSYPPWFSMSEANYHQGSVPGNCLYLRAGGTYSVKYIQPKEKQKNTTPLYQRP